MSAIEIAYVDPAFMVIDTEKCPIPAGTIAVVPHSEEYHRIVKLGLEEQEMDGWEPLPEFTVLCAGQQLKRELYPEISGLYPGTGFYDLELPDLIKKFIIGVNSETGDLIFGDGIIYYQSVPQKEKRVRDIRQA